jgi:RNA polymerase sigma-B factor
MPEGGAISTRPLHVPTRSSRRSANRAFADEQLLARYSAGRSPELRDQLVRRYLPLARYCANEFVRAGEPFDDLLQVACIGLMKALDRYDPSRGVAFSSYALPTMNGELRRHFRDRAWTVRPPRDLQDHALAVDRATTALLHELGRSPTIDDISLRTGLSCEAVLEAREALAARHATSLSAPVGGVDEARPLVDAIGVDDPGFATADRRMAIDDLARTALTLREREILHLRFAEDMTQSEIGAALGLSQMHVSRLLREILIKLRAAADETHTRLDRVSG